MYSKDDINSNLENNSMILTVILLIIKSRFDEFGFRVEEEDGPEQSSKKLLGIPFVEDPQHRS